MADDHDDEDYEVGYGKPPKEHQFKPGQSGNPAGRPKDDRVVKQVLRDVGQELIPITDNGQELTASKQEVLIRALYTRAIKGDNQAAKILINLYCKAPGYMHLFHYHDPR